ncbi:MAG TPA: S9 family peptidase [Bryobacteraceae bacterium]|nr:S9 family peptidase [Bryobacteraceae bacterium]
MSQPPIAKLLPREITVHGDTRVDEYSWLRDREDADTIPYLEAENSYTEAMMAPTKELQEKLYAEILGRIKETDLSVPVRKDNYFYYTRTEQGLAYGISCRKEGSLEAPEEILLDANVLAAGEKYFRLGTFNVSPDHKLLAYSIDVAGDEAYTVFVKDLATGTLLPDKVLRTYYSLEWVNDNRTFFYTVLDAAHRPYRVFRHRLGEPDDVLVYEEPDARFTVGLSKTRSDRYIFINLHSAVTSEVRRAPANDPDAPFTVILPREHEIEYDVTHHGEHFYIRTNKGATNFRLMRTPAEDPSSTAWEEMLPARPGIMIDGVSAFENHIIVHERDRGLPKMRVCRAANFADHHYIEFPEPAYSAFGNGNPEFRTTVFRYTYTSLVTPWSVFDYHMDTRERELKKQTEVLGGYAQSQYVSERIFALAPDETPIPMSVVYRKDTPRDGSAPMMLYGYGSYGASMDPGFSSDRLSLLDRGFVYAIAHIRGGGELGKSWHDAGKLLTKRNTFSDFIACAEHVIAQGYTSRNRLAIMGGSAGGMLMGAVINQRPELFHCVVAKVPFVDVLNTMLDPTLPLTISEYEEWGNPEDRQFYDYIRTYSPYDNVGEQAYPIMLVTSGLNDPRVSYWEPTKWVARLRRLRTDSNLLLLKTNMGTGHFGPSGRYDRIRETAFDYAFLLQSYAP